MIGSINCYCVMEASYKGSIFHFDGTISGLSISAQEFGCVAGDTIVAFDREYVLTTTKDNWCNGIWPICQF